MTETTKPLPPDAEFIGKLIAEMKVSSRIVRSYPGDHPVVKNALQRVYTALQEIFHRRKEITLAIGRDAFIVDEHILCKDNHLYRQMAQQLRRMGIAYIHFSPGLTVDELYNCCHFMSVQSKDLSSQNIIDIFNAYHLSHINVGFLDYEAFSFEEGKTAIEIPQADLWETYITGIINGTLSMEVVVYGTLRDDAALTSLPVARAQGRAGRPRIRGERLPTPAQISSDSSGWRNARATLYSVARTIAFKQMDAQWYQGRRPELLRVVVVRVSTGKLTYRVYFCTDPSRSAVEIVERYTARWQIEVCFRDMKQQLGFGACPARSRNAMERVTPVSAYVYSLVVMWGSTVLRRHARAPQIHRPWYRDKVGLSFADQVHVVRQELLAPTALTDLVKNPAASPNAAFLGIQQGVAFL